MTLQEALAALDGKSELGGQDALTLRQIIFGGDASVSQAEADCLFKLNADAKSVSTEWQALFLEAMCEFAVAQQSPTGYVSAATANWLISTISSHKPVRLDEVELLIRVLERADETPANLSAFALNLVRASVLWRIEHEHTITRNDVERLRRVLFAAGGESNIAVTRHEAEVLFDINDAIKGASVDASWTDFFAKAVGNAVLFEPTWSPDAANASRRDAWLADATIHPLQRLKIFANTSATQGAISEGLREMAHGDYANHQLEQHLRDDEVLEAKAEQINGDEAHWLFDRIGKNGAFDAAEHALVNFVRANGRSVDPSFDALIAQLEGMAKSQQHHAA